MKLLIPSLALLLLVLAGCSNAESSSTQTSEGVQIVNREDKKRIDVVVDDALLTSYLFAEEGSSMKKPILYPLNTANGVNIARRWPFEKQAGERVDHPHHAGHWLNYGDVNGFDFWNHSTDTPAERLDHMGTIVHRAVTETNSGDDMGSFSVEMDWLRPDGSAILKESSHFDIMKADDRRIIDRTTTLTAVDGPVTFTDNKEGFIAIRVTRALEHPDERPVLLSDENGEPRAEREINNEGVTGQYLSETGITGKDVWGTRAPWVVLSGVVDGESVSVAIIDHPENPGYPTYWHARDYGLFAANPLGQKIFSEGAEELNYHLEDGESVTFKYRIAILSDPSDPRAEVTALAAAFTTPN